MMPRRALILLLLLASPMLAGAADTPSPEAGKQAAALLPTALENLLTVTWQCQGVQSAQPYEQSRTLVRNVVTKLIDGNAAERFLSRQDDTLKAACPAAKADGCWRDFLGLKTEPADAGKAQCEAMTRQTLENIGGLLKAMGLQ